jgi:hypothetical protein
MQEPTRILIREVLHSVHPDARKIATHMKDFGLCLLGRSVLDVTFAQMEGINPYTYAMGVVRCAHAAEIIIKARIAEEHPLLIFTKLPKLNPKTRGLLDIGALLAEGQTLMYSNLPTALWGATGYRMTNLEQFERFGRIRNMIMHLAVPRLDLPGETFRFAFRVLRPMIYDFWKSDIFRDCIERNNFGDEGEYVIEQLRRYKIPVKYRS